jgi:hypothetical protein
MGELVHAFASPLLADEESFVVTVRGQRRHDGMWEGWLEFTSPRMSLRTERETVQTTWKALLYWSTGLEPAYLEGAFSRARAVAS